MFNEGHKEGAEAIVVEPPSQGMGHGGGQDDPPAIENPWPILALNHYTLLLFGKTILDMVIPGAIQFRLEPSTNQDIDGNVPSGRIVQ